MKGWGGASGPAVARLFHRLLALVFLDAWLSLGAQVKVLYGEHGLLPIGEFLELARGQSIPFHDIPSLFWINASDRMLVAVVITGIAFSVIALFAAPRVCHGLNTLLYLSFAAVGRSFLMFQWDNLLLECGAFAMFLPRDRRAPWVHTLYRLILFKLYFESGIAKWQSHLHDWQDGSAMTYYYETAPLPTFLAWYAHHLPVWWHHLESWLTLGFELVLPFGIFGPRKVRLGTFAVLTFFQVVNAATANYGFFCYLATCLHVFLLDDSDLPWKQRAAIVLEGRRRDLERAMAILVLTLFCTVSALDGLMELGPIAWAPSLARLHDAWEPLRLINTYHLFGHITRERIEPQLELSTDGTHFEERDFKWKPGRVDRAARFVAPHQPRVDFQLWFYGLSYERGSPTYVVNLLDRACNDPAAIQPLFAEELPAHPAAVRLSFWRYHFTTPSEKAQTGAFFRREKIVLTNPIPCDARIP
jgi:hypothetical protein